MISVENKKILPTYLHVYYITHGDPSLRFSHELMRRIHASIAYSMALRFAFFLTFVK